MVFHVFLVTFSLLCLSSVQSFSLESTRDIYPRQRLKAELEEIAKECAEINACVSPEVLFEQISEMKSYLENMYGRHITWTQIFNEMERNFIKYEINLDLLASFKNFVIKKVGSYNINKQINSNLNVVDDFYDLPPNTRAGISEIAVGSSIAIFGGAPGLVIGGGIVIDGARRICDDYSEYGE